MQHFDYELKNLIAPRLGLIVLQTDERIESDFRRLVPGNVDLFVSRVPSGLDVTPETLQAMHADIPRAAALLPQAHRFDSVGYGCTSGAAQIGPMLVGNQLRQEVQTATVTDPLSALLAACQELGITRLGFLSPYVAEVSERLRQMLAHGGVETPVFGTFAEAQEARVVRIDPVSIQNAVRALATTAPVDGLFLSCTNLDTLDSIPVLEQALGLPVLSSNLVLAWHMCRLAGVALTPLPAVMRLQQACPAGQELLN